MGLLIDGEWHDKWYDTSKTGGRFVRSEANFRRPISAVGDHPPAADRYHLYVAWACPWAHRSLLYRHLKGLTGLISTSVVHPHMLSEGWVFGSDHPDHLFGSTHLHQVYTRARADFTGRVTVPVFWDKQADTIVNNESSEIIRIFDTAFADLADPDAPLAHYRLCPPELTEAIDAVNDDVYNNINNGVYKSGFATSQEAYDEACTALFEAMDRMEERLSQQPWLLGEQLTEADLRLFPTLLRFDPVYHVHFKCSRKRLIDYPHLYDHTRAIYQIRGMRSTLNLDETRAHYFYSHETLNPHRIVAQAPTTLELDAPAERTRALPKGCR